MGLLSFLLMSSLAAELNSILVSRAFAGPHLEEVYKVDASANCFCVREIDARMGKKKEEEECAAFGRCLAFYEVISSFPANNAEERDTKRGLFSS